MESFGQFGPGRFLEDYLDGLFDGLMEDLNLTGNQAPVA